MRSPGGDRSRRLGEWPPYGPYARRHISGSPSHSVGGAYVGPPLPHALGRRATGRNPVARESGSQFPAGRTLILAYAFLPGAYTQYLRFDYGCGFALPLVRSWGVFFGPLNFSAFRNMAAS